MIEAPGRFDTADEMTAYLRGYCDGTNDRVEELKEELRAIAIMADRIEQNASGIGDVGQALLASLIKISATTAVDGPQEEDS